MEPSWPRWYGRIITTTLTTTLTSSGNVWTGGNCDCLWKKAGEWYGDAEYEAVHGIMEKLKEECFVFNDFDEHEVDAFFDEHEDAIRDEIYSRNDSDVVKDLIRYTDDIPIRVEMLSDYDCINSNWFESQGGYSYEESYFGDMVDSLNLNPAQVKETADEPRLQSLRAFPRTGKAGTGKEQVSLRAILRGTYQFLLRCEPADLYRKGKSERVV